MLYTFVVFSLILFYHGAYFSFNEEIALFFSLTFMFLVVYSFFSPTLAAQFSERVQQLLASFGFLLKEESLHKIQLSSLFSTYSHLASLVDTHGQWTSLRLGTFSSALKENGEVSLFSSVAALAQKTSSSGFRTLQASAHTSSSKWGNHYWTQLRGFRSSNQPVPSRVVSKAASEGMNFEEFIRRYYAIDRLILWIVRPRGKTGIFYVREFYKHYRKTF